MNTETLARAFAAVLRNSITADQMAAVVSLNRMETTPGVCHSHDYCDANDAMAIAFERVAGRAPDVASDADTAAWSAAWDMARDRAFFPEEFKLASALRLAEKTIADNLTASGYRAGSCTDGWVPEIRAQVAALASIRATLAGYAETHA